MGGFIALAVRYSDGQEYRGSCWTNVLPDGLFGHGFYLEDESEAHTRKWLDNILKERREDRELEEMWGGWNKLAPDGYGIVLVDYKTGTVISANGYTNPLTVYTFSYPERIGKFIRLHEAGLLEGVEIEKQERKEGEKKFNPATEKEIRNFIDKAADLVYLDPKEGWMFSKPESYDQAEFPLFFARIKLWLPRVFNFDREPGFEKKRAEVRQWVGENFDLSKAEKKVWNEWIRETSYA